MIAIARASAGPLNMSRAMACSLHDAAGQKIRQVVCQAAPDAAGEEHDKSDQDWPASSVAIRKRPDQELAQSEHRKKDRDGGGDRRAGDIQ